MTDKREWVTPWHDATWQGRPSYDELRAEIERLRAVAEVAAKLHRAQAFHEPTGELWWDLGAALNALDRDKE